MGYRWNIYALRQEKEALERKGFKLRGALKELERTLISLSHHQAPQEEFLIRKEAILEQIETTERAIAERFNRINSIELLVGSKEATTREKDIWTRYYYEGQEIFRIANECKLSISKVEAIVDDGECKIGNYLNWTKRQ